MGVDIFFVISGFLITGSIIQEIDQQKFSFIKFYLRRIIRIFPALIILLLFVIIVGQLILYPDEIKNLGKHVFAGATFLSNVSYFRENGYFDFQSNQKPLLQLWTLGIEQQFYLLWPLVIFVLKSRKRIKNYLLLITLISFLNSIYYSFNSLSHAFYLIDSRIWELSFGGLIYCYKDEIKLIKIDFKPEIFLYSGLFLIAISYIIIDPKFLFPGFYAAIPVLGSGIVLIAADLYNKQNRLLGNRFLVFIGGMSYSLYLWHWTLLSLTNIYLNDRVNFILKLIIISLSILISFISRKYIELYFINLKISPKKNATFLIIIMISISIIGLLMYKSNNSFIRHLGKLENELLFYSQDYDYFGSTVEAIDRRRCFNLTEDYKRFEENRCSKFNQINTAVLIGDSHSAYIASELKAMLETKNIQLIHFSAAYCTPLSLLDKTKRCRDIAKYIDTQIKLINPNFIIVFGNYYEKSGQDFYGEDDRYESVILNRAKEYASLGAKIIIIGQIPVWNLFVPKMMLRDFVRVKKEIPISRGDGLVSESIAFDERLQRMQWPTGTKYYSLREKLCDANRKCLLRIPSSKNVELIVWDNSHLTKHGARMIVGDPDFRSLF